MMTMRLSRWQPKIIWILSLYFITGIRAELLLNIQTIGSNASKTGSAQIGSYRYELRGWSSGFSDSSDNIIFAYANPDGNFDFSTNCSYMQDTTNSSEAGIMVREDTTNNSSFLSITRIQENKTIVRYRLPSQSNINTIIVSDTLYRWLRIKRTGNLFSIYCKNLPSSIWQSVSSYTLNFPSAICAGIIHSSNNVNNNTMSRFENIQGLPESKIDSGTTCSPVQYNFNNGLPIDSLGFRNVQFWNIDTGKFLISTTPGGYFNRSQLLLPHFNIPLNSDSLNISWNIKFIGDTTSRIQDFSLFSYEAMAIGDRGRIRGSLIGSNQRINLGINDTINGEIRAGRDIVIGDRSIITGNLFATDTVKIGSGTSIYGTVTEYTSQIFPVIRTKTVGSGTTSITISPNDSATISPGNYDSLQIYSNARVRFLSGVYNCKKFKCDTDVKIYLAVDSINTLEVNVSDEVQIGDRSKFTAIDTSSCANIAFYSNQSTQLRLGTDVKLVGYFSFPNAEVIFSSRGIVLKGGLHARKITLEPDVDVTVESVKLHQNEIITSIFSGDSAADVYTIHYKTHQSRFLDTTDDIFIKKGSTILRSISTGNPTPINRWLGFRVAYVKRDSISSMRLFYDDGFGTMLLADSIAVSDSNLSSIGFDYITGTGINNEQTGIDDISLSCTRDTCSPIIILRQPADTSVFEGATVKFKCVVDSGSFLPIFQWYRNSVPIPFANRAEHTIYNVSFNQDSNSVYRCLITGRCETDSTRAAILTVKKCTIPKLTAGPDSDTADVGDTVYFRVFASDLELSYQWKCNDRDIPGETDSILPIYGVTGDLNNNRYSVFVKNGCGKDTLSKYAVLTVRNGVSCRIITQPVGDTLYEKDYFVTRVEASCPQAQISWLKNGIMISGATGTEFIDGPLTLGDDGSKYVCVIDNGNTSDTSDNIQIKVLPPRPGQNLISISGKLFYADNIPVGLDSAQKFRFKVQIFPARNGNASLYTEEFSGSRGIIVSNTSFTITLGRGSAAVGNLQKVVTANKELYAEIYAAKDMYGTYEKVAPRFRLTAAPYAFTSGVKVIYGNGNPYSSGINIPMGTLYIDQTGSKSTWKLSGTGWKKLD